VDTLTSIKVFRHVVEFGSFVSASERLDLSTAMVSKHVMHIEKRLGVRLLNRNSHKLSLTEPGRVYFERCKNILDDLEQTELELASLSTVPRGTLRITCPSWISQQRFADLMAGLRRRCPEILIDVSFEDRLVDLVEEGFDLALRVTSKTDSFSSGLIARPIRPLPYYAGASREYLARHGAPRLPEDLVQHDCVAVGNADGWMFTGPKGRKEVPVRVVMRYRSMAGVANAVAAGVGLAPLPGLVFEDPAFNDVLVPVLSEYPLESPTLYVVYASRKYLPLKIRAFIDFLFESISQIPVAKPPLHSVGVSFADGASAQTGAPLPMSRPFLRRNDASIK
jgi:DNA-binding transcriptional LysR family regulator